MSREFPRSLRVAEQIHRELAIMLRDEVKDPRLKDVVITEVLLSRDLSFARVFYTVFGESEKTGEIQKGLEHAASFLRKKLGEILHIRIIPQLRFEFDLTETRSSRLEKILRENLDTPDS